MQKKIVPYVASWTAEVERMDANPHYQPIVVSTRYMPGGPIPLSSSWRAGYPDEHPLDRDRYGVLWQRFPSARGQGAPMFAVIHGTRQRRAMNKRLCQVCGQPADVTSDGVLWLLTYVEDPAPGSVRTPNPPICRACVDITRALCPGIGKGSWLVRARSVSDWGVYGRRPTQSTGLPVTRICQALPHDDPDIHQFVASQRIAELTDITVLDTTGICRT